MAEDITKLKPQIVFADGTFATFKTLKEVDVTENDVTEKYIEFILYPTLKARIKWKIQKNEKYGFIEKGEYMGWFRKRYKKDNCRQLDLSPSSVWILSCDYMANYIDLYGGEVEIWKSKNEFLRKKIKTLSGIINAMAYDMAKESSDPMLYIKKRGKALKGVLDDLSSPIIAGQPQGGDNNG